MTRQRSRLRQSRRDTPRITDDQVTELLGRAVPGVNVLGPVRRPDARGQRQVLSVPVLADQAQIEAQSRRAGQKVLASLSRVERRLLARTALSNDDRRALAVAIRDARRIVTPLLVGFE